MAGTARVIRLHTCPHADSTGELRGARKAEGQAHLLGHSASQVLQHVQHLEDVKRTYHLDPLESSCLKGSNVFALEDSFGEPKSFRNISGSNRVKFCV